MRDHEWRNLGPVLWLLLGVIWLSMPALGGETSPVPAGEIGGSPSGSGIVTKGASPLQRDRIEQAATFYSALGLELPELEVVFTRESSACTGAKGLFSDSFEPWRVTICTEDPGIVIEHELAHAWERANVGDHLRETFMEQNGYGVWRSHDVPWNERAVEGIALVIQQGASGLPLPPVLGSDATGRLQAFELLTGQPDPRLADWLGSKSIPCGERPTPLSDTIPDSDGLICG
jgi:hypothetical protein